MIHEDTIFDVFQQFVIVCRQAMESHVFLEISLVNLASLWVAASMKQKLEFNKNGAFIPQVCGTFLRIHLSHLS